MSTNRIGRINEEIQRELSALLRNVKDPRVQKTMISVTRVQTTSDLRYAKVYVSMLDKDQTREVLKGLKSAGGWLRRELGAKLQLRYTPELVWEVDDSITHGARIFDILANVPRLGKGRCVRNRKRDVQHLGDSLGEQRLSAPRRPRENDVAFLYGDVLQFLVVESNGIVRRRNATIVVVYGNGKNLLRLFLSDNALVQFRLYLPRG